MLSTPKAGLFSSKACRKSAIVTFLLSKLILPLPLLVRAVPEAFDFGSFSFYPITDKSKSLNKAKEVADLQTASISAPV